MTILYYINNAGYREYSKLAKIRKWLHIGSGIFSVVMILLATIVFIVAVDASLEFSEKNKYQNYMYPEFLIKNPDYKLTVNGKELTKYSRPDLKMPLVIEITKAGDLGTDVKHEVFVNNINERVPIIENRLYVQTQGDAAKIMFHVRKDESVISAAEKEHKIKMEEAEGALVFTGQVLISTAALWFITFEGLFFFIVNTIIAIINFLEKVFTFCKEYIEDAFDDEEDDEEDVIEIK